MSRDDKTGDLSLSTFDMAVLINGIRTAIDFGVGALAVVAQPNEADTSVTTLAPDTDDMTGTNSSNITTAMPTTITAAATLTGKDDLTFSKRTVILTWTAVEFAFFGFMMAHLLKRWIMMCRNETKMTPDGANVLVARLMVAVFSLVTAILLSTDLSGAKDESVVAIAFMVMTSFLNNAILDKFKDQQTTSDNPATFFSDDNKASNSIATNLDHVYTDEDMRLVWRALIRKYNATAGDDNLLDGTHYQITKNGGIPNQIILTAPPIVLKQPRGVANIHEGIGYGTPAAYLLDPATANLNLPAHAFSQLPVANFTDNVNRTLTLLFPCKGLDTADIGRWSSVEIEIEKETRGADGAAAQHFDIKIYMHSPYGDGRLKKADYFAIASQINRILKNDYNIPAAQIHFQSQTDINDIANNNAANIVIEGAPNATALDENTLPVSIHNQPRLKPSSDKSYLATLNDLNKIMQGKGLTNKELGEKDEIELRDSFRTSTMFLGPEAEVKGFKERSEKLVPLYNYTFGASNA